MTDTVVTSGTASSPNPAPSPLPIDLTSAIAVCQAAETVAVAAEGVINATAGNVQVWAASASGSASAASSSAATAAGFATGLTIGTVTTGAPGATITGTLGAQKLNLVIPNFYTLNAPTTTVLGGVLSSAAPANNFATGVSTSGIVTYAQPSFTNISGTVLSAQLASGAALANIGFTPANKAGDSFTGPVIGLTSANPSSGYSTFAFRANGAYGGGFALVDGAYNIALYSTAGTLNIGFASSGGAFASKVNVDAAGNIVGTSFSGTVAWSNISGKPTDLSSFTNSPGYITGAGAAYPRRSDGTQISLQWSGQSSQPSWLLGSNDGATFLVWNPSNFNVNYATTAGSLPANSWVSGNFNVYGSLEVDGNLSLNGESVAFGYAARSGWDGSFTGNKFNISWAGFSANLYIDNYNAGVIYTTSDPRLKHDFQKAQSGLDLVSKLESITFRWANVGIWKDDGNIHYGFNAKQVHSVFPDATHGEPDAVNEDGSIAPQSMNLTAIVSALVGAVQELTARVEYLEARQ